MLFFLFFWAPAIALPSPLFLMSSHLSAVQHPTSDHGIMWQWHSSRCSQAGQTSLHHLCYQGSAVLSVLKGRDKEFLDVWKCTWEIQGWFEQSKFLLWDFSYQLSKALCPAILYLTSTQKNRKPVTACLYKKTESEADHHTYFGNWPAACCPLKTWRFFLLVQVLFFFFFFGSNPLYRYIKMPLTKQIKLQQIELFHTLHFYYNTSNSRSNLSYFIGSYKERDRDTKEETVQGIVSFMTNRLF